MRIPEWNAGKRWYSGPSASGRGGHGNGRGQVLRVVRNGQGREISPYRCTFIYVIPDGGIRHLVVRVIYVIPDGGIPAEVS